MDLMFLPTFAFQAFPANWYRNTMMQPDRIQRSPLAPTVPSLKSSNPVLISTAREAGAAQGVLDQ